MPDMGEPSYDWGAANRLMARYNEQIAGTGKEKAARKRDELEETKAELGQTQCELWALQDALHWLCGRWPAMNEHLHQEDSPTSFWGYGPEDHRHHTNIRDALAGREQRIRCDEARK